MALHMLGLLALRLEIYDELALASRPVVVSRMATTGSLGFPISDSPLRPSCCNIFVLPLVATTKLTLKALQIGLQNEFRRGSYV